MDFTQTKIDSLIQQFGLPIQQWGEDELSSVLHDYKGGSRGTFLATKSKLARWVKENLPEEDAERIIMLLKDVRFQEKDFSSIIRELYFFSPHDLRLLLDMRIAQLQSVLGENPNKYLIPKVALLLAWDGFTVNDIPNIEKSDVIQNGTEISFNGRIYSISPYFSEDVLLLKNSEELEYEAVFPHYRGRATRQICESEFLFRTTRSQRLNPGLIKALISSLNNKEVMSSKQFLYDKIYESGMFYRALLDERKNGPFYHKAGKKYQVEDQNRAMRLFEIPDIQNPLTAIYSKIRLYDEYKRNCPW